jgi:hypothetical protein
MKTWYWIRHAHELLWHAVPENETEALCGKHIYPPRLAKRSDDVPYEDERCAKCEKQR